MLSVREGSKLCQRQAVTKENQDAQEKDRTPCHTDYLLKHSFIQQKEGVTGNVSVKR